MTTVLIALTGAGLCTMKDGRSVPAGFWADEFVEPHSIFSAAGFTVQVATPGAVLAPLQEQSLHVSKTGSEARGLELRRSLDALSSLLRRPLDLADVDPDGLDGIYLPGGLGAVQDLHSDTDLGRILGSLRRRRAVVAAACRGVVGLLPAHDESGTWPFKGYELTGFSDEEEAQAGFLDSMPFTAESRLREAGAYYHAGAPWAPFVITDRNLITGQNPASAAEVARQTVLAVSRT